MDDDKSGDLPSSGDPCLETDVSGVPLDGASPTSFGVADLVAKHVLSSQHMSPHVHRAYVLAHEMTACSQPAQAQTLRTRLGAHKARLCGTNFELGV